MKGKWFVLQNTGGGTCRVINFAQKNVSRDFHENVELIDNDGDGVSKAEAETYCSMFFERVDAIKRERAS